MTPRIRHPLRERLGEGALCLGVTVMLARTVQIARLMKTSGYDWLFIDLEHGSMPVETAVQISVAALDAGIAPIVRVPAGEWGMATRALDGGALGLALPHVESAADARAAVSALRYPPVGRRSILGSQAVTEFRAIPPAELTEAVNEMVFLAATLESPGAIENAEAIAATPGIDALLVGASDLSLAMGIPGQVGHPAIQGAFAAVAAACSRHGKWSGMGGIADDGLLARYVGLGMRLIVVGSDLGFVLSAASERARLLRALGRPAQPAEGA